MTKRTFKTVYRQANVNPAAANSFNFTTFISNVILSNSRVILKYITIQLDLRNNVGVYRSVDYNFELQPSSGQFVTPAADDNGGSPVVRSLYRSGQSQQNNRHEMNVTIDTGTEFLVILIGQEVVVATDIINLAVEFEWERA